MIMDLNIIMLIQIITNEWNKIIQIFQKTTRKVNELHLVESDQYNQIRCYKFSKMR